MACVQSIRFCRVISHAALITNAALGFHSQPHNNVSNIKGIWGLFPLQLIRAMFVLVSV